MIEIRPFGARSALFPAVGWRNGEVALLYSTTIGELIVERFSPDLVAPGQVAIVPLVVLEPVNAMHAFVRIAGDWIIYKLDEGDSGYAVLRSLVTGERRVLGVCTGNWPVGIALLHHAWQWEEAAGWRGLTIGPTSSRAFVGAGTGLAYLQDDGTPVLNDDNRLSEPGMVNPQRAGNFIAGEKGAKGILCRRVSDGYEYELWAGQETQTPQVATDGAALYVTCWSPAEGVRLARVDPADFQPPYVPPLPTAKLRTDDPVQGPAPFRITVHADLLNATDWRWLCDGLIVGADTLTHTYSFLTPGTFTLGLRAAGPGGTVLADPITVTVTEAPPKPFIPGWLGLCGGAGRDVLPTIAGFGWEMIRCERNADIQAVIDAGLRPYVSIRGPQDIPGLPDQPLDLGLWNEPNGGSPGWTALTPRAYCTLTLATLAALTGLPHRLWIGEINNLSRDALAWLAEALRFCGTGYYGIGIHRYPEDDLVPEHPHDDFRSREAEVAALKAIIGARPFGCSEVGYHQAAYQKGWLDKLLHRTRHLNDGEVIYRRDWERRFWQRMGADFLVWYQYTDGPGNTPLDRYGIRRYDGTWKPQARIIS